MATGPRVWLLQARDRFIATDPGLTRLRQAATAAFAMATALAVEYGFAQLQSGPPLIPMLLGAVLALMGSMALTDTSAWAKTKTAAPFPVALGLGLLLGATVAANVDLMLGVFVLVMFAAVFVRRFGPAFFFYGFMFWMGYFFAAFLHASVSMLPWLIADVVVAAAWVLLLSVTVLRTNPRRRLSRTLHAFGARVRAVARECAELAEIGEHQADRWQRRVRARQNRLAETALVIEGWSAEPGALPHGWSAIALRRHLVDAQLAVEELATAAKALVGGDRRVAAAAAAIAGQLARREYANADAAARALLSRLARAGERAAGSWWAARHFGTAVTEYVAVTRRFDRVRTGGPDDEFEPVVALVMGGMLPGSGAVAGDVRPRGRWGLLGKFDLTTRQAVQVAIAGALAILAGRELSSTRYYWAVLAAFIAFTGTATRSETFVKATNRVLGTLVGLGAGIGLAHLTAGHTGWILVVIIASMFCGLYLIQVGYAYMIFFVTIMVSQLYTVLNEFSSELLVLRLEETAIGAAIGILVALTLTPLSTRDVVRSVQRDLLTDLAALLTTAGERLRDRSAGDLDTLARTLDDRVRQLYLVAAPLTRPLLWHNSPRLARHRLTLCSSCVHYGRRLGAVLQSSPEAPGLAAASTALAGTCTGLAEILAPPGRRHEPAEQLPWEPKVAFGAYVAPKVTFGSLLREKLADADAALFAGTGGDHPAHRPLMHLWQLLSELVAAAPVPTHAPKPAAAVVIGGTVRDEAGAALAGATVTLVDTAGRQLGKANTGADGGYRLATPGSGTYLLVTLAPGHAAGASRITLTGHPVTHDLTLAATIAIAGTVTDADGPVAGTSMSLIGGDGAVAASAHSDAAGRFALGGVAAGRYSLAVSRAGYLPAARTVTVLDGTTGREDVRLVRAARLTGRASARPTGCPVSYARITVRDGHGRLVATTDADQAGRYSIPGLAPGRYTVTASGFPAVTHPLRARCTDRVTLDVDLRH
ncbi:MAG TPA: carboxypeptidase regulatory-like domain-containing protein [Amycolatopsis sp.]|nr:carboxypeptidase regulatory-like domain-containing protein [Amycolatopsis sp.]